jgi:hypothetical protein
MVLLWRPSENRALGRGQLLAASESLDSSGKRRLEN